MKKQQLVRNSWRTSRVRPESRKKMSILKKGKAEIELIKFQPVLKTSGSVPESTAGLLMGPVPLPAGTAASCPGLGQCQSLHSAGYRLGNVRARRWLSGFLQSCEYGKRTDICMAAQSVTRFLSCRRTRVSTWAWLMTATTTCWLFGIGRRSPRSQRSRWASLSQLAVKAFVECSQSSNCCVWF